MHIHAEDMEGGVRLARRRREDGVEAQRTGQHEGAEDAQREAEVADTVDHEGLDRRRRGRGLLVPEADQQVRGQTHAFPAEEQLHHVVGGDQHQHGEGEQRQIALEARHAGIVMHVPDRVDMHHERHPVDHDQHDRRQGIEAERPGDVGAARGNEGEQLHRLRMRVQHHIIEDHHRQQGRKADAGAGDNLRGPVADLAAEKAGNDGAQEREEDYGSVHVPPTPSSG